MGEQVGSVFNTYLGGIRCHTRSVSVFVVYIIQYHMLAVKLQKPYNTFYLICHSLTSNRYTLISK